MAENNALELNGVSVSYGKTRILKDISLRIPKGIIHVIIGPSGAGKTTLIKVINGLVKPQKGTVKVLGHSLKKSTMVNLRSQIGYIPQNMGLVRILSARENVLMGGLKRVGTLRSIFNIFPKEEIEHADKLLGMLGLESKKNVKVYRLSGGEKRRVAIARALMQNPKILLADEFLSDIDFVKTELIMKKIKELKKKFDLTVIMVEHDICVAKEFGDKVAFMRNGKLIPELSAKELDSVNLCRMFE